MKTCIVKNCTNTDDPEEGGVFVGDLCAPCHRYITTGDGVHSQAFRNSRQKTLVKLQYYKATGKYYSSGEYESMHAMLWDICKEVRAMRADGRLPGLVVGATEFIVFIEGNDPFGVPHILPL